MRLPCRRRSLLNGQGEELEFLVPVLYRWTDRVDGESYRLFEVRPKVTVEIGDGVRVFADTNPQEIRVRVKANSPGVDGTLRLSGDSDWHVVPESVPFSLSKKYDEAEFSFQVTPPDDAGDAVFVAEADVGGTTFSRALVTISHPAHQAPGVLSRKHAQGGQARCRTAGRHDRLHHGLGRRGGRGSAASGL